MPEVALVELPPKKAGGGNVSVGYSTPGMFDRTLLVQNHDVATVQVDGVGSTEARHWRKVSEHDDMMRGRSTYDHRRPQ